MQFLLIFDKFCCFCIEFYILTYVIMIYIAFKFLIIIYK